jgi:hypothetical protein
VGDITAVSALHLLCTVAVIDGQTGKPIAIMGLTFRQKVEPVLARTKFTDLGEAKIAEVRSMLVNLPKDAWETKFRELFAIAAN